jgi:hypothetical protein
MWSEVETEPYRIVYPRISSVGSRQLWSPLYILHDGDGFQSIPWLITALLHNLRLRHAASCGRRPASICTHLLVHGAVEETIGLHCREAFGLGCTCESRLAEGCISAPVLIACLTLVLSRPR